MPKSQVSWPSSLEDEGRFLGRFGLEARKMGASLAHWWLILEVKNLLDLHTNLERYGRINGLDNDPH